MPTPKKPQDHQPKADAVNTEYTHSLPDGREFTLTLMSHLETDFGFKRRIRKMGDDEAVIELVEKAADAEALAVIDTLNDDEAADFIKAWGKASGVEAGESSASSGS